MIFIQPVGFPGGGQCRRHERCRFDPWVREIAWRRAWQPTPVCLPEESHEQRSLVGYSPQGLMESDTTEVTQHACTHVYNLCTHAHMFTICVQVSPLSKFCPGVWNPIRNVHFNSLSCFLNFYIECLCSFSLAVYLLKDSNSTVFPIVCIFLPASLCTCFFSGLLILKLVVRTEGMIRFRFKFNNFCF